MVKADKYTTMNLLITVLCLAGTTAAAVIRTHDLTEQMTYPCPNDAELSCVTLWVYKPRSGMLGTSENIYRLQCQETPHVNPECALPEAFEMNRTKLIKPRPPGRRLTLDSYRSRGHFVELGCKPTQTAVCVALQGEGFRIKDTQYVLKLRCKDVGEKDCSISPIDVGEKLTAIMQFEAL